MSTQDNKRRAQALGLERALRWYERGWSWLLVSILFSAALIALLVVAMSGSLADIDPDVFAPVLRGYTAHGELFGVIAATTAGLSLLFSVRKRWLQERWPLFRGSMVSWLWLHVFAGLIALLATLLHAGFGLFDVQITTGKVLLWLLLLVSFSGILWRIVYKVVPAGVARKIGNYSEQASAERARDQALEMEKVAAGGSALLHEWKDWLIERARNQREIDQARSNFAGSPEAGVFAQLCELAASRDRALTRQRLQKAATGRLQGWRILHVPVSLAFAVLLPIHLIEVYDVAPKYLPPETRAKLIDMPKLSGVHDPAACGECHQAIYEQWRHSMHAHALTSPVTVVQNNQVMLRELNDANVPDPKRICVNCHGPIATELAQTEMLPFPGGPAANQGITCSVCHQFTGTSRSGGGAYTDVIIDGHEPGRVVYGPFAGAVGNPYHQSRLRPELTQDPTLMCQNCHDVNFDRDKNGKIELGHDLVLQTTFGEYLEYRKNGGPHSCIECHMPVVNGLTRAAESARIGDQQDVAAPPRLVRDHSFVGVDYPLDHDGKTEPHRPARVQLLRAASKFVVTPPKLTKPDVASVSVSISNTGAGHNLPSGFAFARQMWVELVARDAVTNAVVYSSGVVQANTDDLCDAATMAESNGPIRQHVQGCKRPDPQLVNFQRRLVDKADVLRDAQGTPVTNERGELTPVAAEGATEQSIQRVAGNPVARLRPSDKQPLISIPPGKTRTFSYAFTLPPTTTALSVKARLMFRNLPPYFLRDLAANQPPGDQPQLGPMIENLDVVEMATATSKAELERGATGAPVETPPVAVNPAPVGGAVPKLKLGF